MPVQGLTLLTNCAMNGSSPSGTGSPPMIRFWRMGEPEILVVATASEMMKAAIARICMAGNERKDDKVCVREK
jgi:hypothetical protein